MEKSTREKVALVVFAALIVFAGIILTSYFSTGRSWTQAATFVDDTVGSMDGYCAIVYPGTIPVGTHQISPDDEQDEGSAGTQPGEHTEPSEGAAIDKASLGEASERQTNRTKRIEPVDPSQQNGSAQLNPSDVAVEGVIDPENSLGLKILSLYPRLINEEYDGVFVSDVRELYERKDAKVITLDTANPKSYEDPIVIRSGNKRIGVFSATKYLNRSALQRYREYFDDKGADVVVCITPRVRLISNPDMADIVIVTDPILNPIETRYLENTLVIEAPEKGDVGVILLSSNNVPISRSIEAL